MIPPLFFLVPLCTVSLLTSGYILTFLRLQCLKQAGVFSFCGETVVGRPTGMFSNNKDREMFQVEDS